MVDGKPRIGDEVYIHGYIDEIRNDVIIIRNEGGYFGTSDREIFYYEEDERGYGTMNEADRKTESNSEKPNNSTISKMEQVETMSCQECKHYNGNDGCDVMTSNKAKCNYEPIEDEPQKWETPPKFEHKGTTTTCVSVPAFMVKDEPQTCDHRCVQTEIGCEQTDCAWR